ncbi:hypothetical protein C5E22_11895 [Pectobacterium parmentieri]|uniref:Uncharacterized protein n=1 Tax=Pectobacterium parmentieri TaxID=1905730 RepID=A0A8B3F6J8_PECPM|nr:hypothetical protein A8F97_07815 [Pectobacterium parmentieri]AYH10151.1 hypothetical protein C5E24_10895 [Pectobacterium parmentieri]AYH19138.1 hypothetical protein C5E22_11895 [Pectobacterium parmentieri]AYH36470.1 hypothetical protein C5E17_10840 [Pectobacterium parmentieri]AZS56576.1 hypothetical protein C5E18_10840 [Pectobacterium parmentieri]
MNNLGVENTMLNLINYFIVIFFIAISGTLIKKILFKKNNGAGLVLSIILSTIVAIPNLFFTVHFIEWQPFLAVHTTPNFTFAFLAAYVFYCTIKQDKKGESVSELQASNHDDNKNNPWLK